MRMNLQIIGTSHIAQQSIDEIKKRIEEDKPDIIALELDTERAAVLLDQRKQKKGSSLQQVRAFGLKGYLFARLGQYVQQKLGKSAGSTPGAEMKTALELARKNNIEVALIDQPIRLTLQKFSKSFTWKERWRFVEDIFIGIFRPRKQLEKWKISTFDLRRVPAEEVIIEMVENVKDRYPSLYKTLIEDRNKYMVKKLVQLMRQYKDKKILAIVGAGHKKGMEKMLLKVDLL